MEYRKEVDGLRALAVIPIILFHAGFRYFKGGFVGVDIFFVISGYLITSVIIEEQRDGAFSLLRFYERRARRILPALFVMMSFCLPISWIWLMPDDFKKFAQSVIDVPLFISNITFLNQTGYFDTSAELKPLLHTWSLAVEEQYYLIFPFFLLKSEKIETKKIVFIIIFIAFVSLIAAHIGSYRNPERTFFLLPTRIWELFIGVLAAFYISNDKKTNYSTIFNQSLSFLGLFLVLFAIFNFDKQTPFPSFYALIPTVGTVLMILFATEETIVGKVLGIKLFVGIGIISYSAYLWHQPIFAFARYHSLSELSKFELVALLVATLLVAYLCWKYIEQPFRNKRNFKRHQIFISGILCSIMFIILGFCGKLNKGWEQRFKIPREVAQSLEPSKLRNVCDQNYNGKGWGIEFCQVGDAGATPSVAVFGDSHSESILPAFDAAGKTLGIGVIHLGLGGCPPLLGIDVVNGNYELGVCKQLADRQFNYVKSNKIKKVFLVARWTRYTDGRYNGEDILYLGLNLHDKKTKDASRIMFEDSFRRTIKSYIEIGTEIYVVLDIPIQITSPVQVYYKIYSQNYDKNQKRYIINEISVSADKNNEWKKYIKSVFLDTKYLKSENLLTFDKIFCNEDVCLMGTADRSFYCNHDHISDYGARLITNEIIRVL